MSSISSSMFRNFERMDPQEPNMRPESGRPDWQSIPQHNDDEVEWDELSDEPEYNPKPRANNSLTIKKPKQFNLGRNRIKLDRNKRALVRALAKRGKWHYKEIAAVFHVSLPLIKRTVANSYTAITDEVSEDANFYKQSDLEELILERLPSAPKKKRKRKTQDKTYTRSSKKSVQKVFRRQRVVASPSVPVPMEVELDSNITCSIFKMFRDEAALVHGEKVHSILEEIGIEDDETMFAVLTMDDERLNGMLQEAKRLNLVEKYSVIQAMRDFGRNHKIAK
ncbi:hypothetical protein BD769DRAFT_1773710 [Suillus cothurnatus]|nr:hypothetical protein BD769DRAFT_1773710 [Suillus cothurnatus]